jgi:pyruvate dehydrogenase E1 component alpha subunit
MQTQFVLDDVVTVLGPDGVADPATDPGLPPEKVVGSYKHMVLTRCSTSAWCACSGRGASGFTSGRGEEACILGPAAALGDDDWLFPCYREFGALLLRGMPLQTYLDNMYGNATTR